MPSDEKVSLYTFIGDHSTSNSEKWSMKVGGHTFSDANYGDIQRDQTDYLAGQTYPITVTHDSSNRQAGPDYDYRAWVDKDAVPKWTDGATADRGSNYFVADDNSPALMQKRWFGADQNNADGKTAQLVLPSIDLDIGSSGSGGSYVAPDHSDAEDNAETTAANAKEITLSSDDIDGDKIPDFADFNGVSGTSAALHFISITLKLSSNISLAGNINPDNIYIKFAYDASDPNPTSITTSQSEFGGQSISTPAAGTFRIWRVDGDKARPLAQYIKPNTPYSLTSLGMTLGQEKPFFVEAVRAGAAASIQVSADIVGDKWSGVVTDKVYAKGVKHNVGAYTELDAYIPNTIGDPSANPNVNLPGVSWGVNPPGASMPAGWTSSRDFPAGYQGQGAQTASVFATDDRASASQPGSSRVTVKMSSPMAATTVGKVAGSAASVFQAMTGASYEAQMDYIWNLVPGIGWIAGAYIANANTVSQPQHANPTTTFSYRNSADGLSTKFSLSIAASYPFSSVAPNVNIDLTIVFATNDFRDTVWLSASGTTDSFPAYAFYKGQGQTKLVSDWQSPDAGPTLLNLTTSRNVDESWIS